MSSPLFLCGYFCLKIVQENIVDIFRTLKVWKGFSLWLVLELFPFLQKRLTLTKVLLFDNFCLNFFNEMLILSYSIFCFYFFPWLLLQNFMSNCCLRIVWLLVSFYFLNVALHFFGGFYRTLRIWGRGSRRLRKKLVLFVKCRLKLRRRWVQFKVWNA